MSDHAATAAFTRIEASMRQLAAHWLERPNLSQLAAQQGLSQAHFQRLFTRLAGVSPRQFQAALTLPHVLAALAHGRSVLEATYEAGLSSPSRAHELVVSALGLTPAEFRRQGEGRRLRYAVLPTRLGLCFIAASELGLAALAFEDGSTPQPQWLASQLRRWPAATWQEDATTLQPLLERILGLSDSPATQASQPLKRPPELALDLRGSQFQMQVWAALLALPAGALVSYGDVARALGRPQASRAVGQAVGANPIAVLIPCHRVIQASGALGGYRWGLARKLTLLGAELQHTPLPPHAPHAPASAHTLGQGTQDAA